MPIAPETKVLPRWSILRSLAKPFVLWTVSCGFLSANLLINYRPTARSVFQFPSVPLVVYIASLAIPVWFLLRDWAKMRSELFESETYLVLFCTAVYLSAWFGIANYVIYVADSNSFIIDQKLEQTLTSAQEQQWQQRLNESTRLIHNCETLVRLLQQEPGEQLSLFRLTHDSYQTTLKASDVVIDY